MKNIRKVFSKKKVCDNQSGFTLLEVLIGISILTIGLLGVAQMQIMGIQGNYFSGNTTTALTLAEEKMEDLLGKGYTHAELTSGNHPDANNPIDETGQAGGIYSRTWNVTDNTPITNTKTVTVSVGWDNLSHQVSLSCIKPQ
jgi:type IV pilus assembly protein PilV